MKKYVQTQERTNWKLDAYHQRIQSKRSRMQAHPHEWATRMLQSNLIYSKQSELVIDDHMHVVDEKHTSDCDFSSNVKHEENRQKVNSSIPYNLTEFAVVVNFSAGTLCRTYFSGSP